jgi:beta-lactamase class D
MRKIAVLILVCASAWLAPAGLARTNNAKQGARKPAPKAVSGKASPSSKAAKSVPRKAPATAQAARKPAAKAPVQARTAAPVKKPQVQARATAKSVPTTRAASRSTASRRLRIRKPATPWDAPTYADSTWGDSIDGEDLTVRRAAVEALGPYNGSVVVADATNGRLLSIVNQKMALKDSYTPCSTIKLISGLAGLSEGAIDTDTNLRLSRRQSMNLTQALAVSNNPFFQKVGKTVGFDRFKHYAQMFGLGEKAGLNIEGESAGAFPEEPSKDIPESLMYSHGTTISLTPLQLTAVVSAIANGGTLYWLQYPQNQQTASSFEPRVKRYLEVQEALPGLKPGMLGTTEFGSGRRASYAPDEPILGKTGTCTDQRAHLGWFGSFNEVGRSRLAVVVLLTGGRRVNGPLAAEIAGQVYKSLSQQQYFARGSQGVSGSLHCCSN